MAEPVRKPKEFRCNPRKDTVTTAAGQDAFICLAFARGTCPAGRACTQLHRLPTEADEKRCQELQVDVFGRQAPAGSRAAAHTRDNCTLYVNYRGAGSYGLPQIRKLLEDNFNAWGPCVNISIKHHLTIAFVTYEWRCTAEFAREAMEGQKLMGSTQAEVLMLRWSTGAGADGGARGGKRGKDQGADDVSHYVGADWDSLTEAERAKAVEGLQMEAALKRRHVVSYYPNTDHQYASEDQGTQVGSTGGWGGSRGLPATGYTTALNSTQHHQPTGYGSRVAASSGAAAGAGAGPQAGGMGGAGDAAGQGLAAAQGPSTGEADDDGVTNQWGSSKDYAYGENPDYPIEEGWQLADDGHYYNSGPPQGEEWDRIRAWKRYAQEEAEKERKRSLGIPDEQEQDGLSLLGGYASEEEADG